MRLFLLLVLTLIFMFGGPPASAAQTCPEMQALCAARCKQRAPADRNCVSDHCTPKLGQCRADGCWQEGALYGGRRTCGLRKS